MDTFQDFLDPFWLDDADSPISDVLDTSIFDPMTNPILLTDTNLLQDDVPKSIDFDINTFDDDQCNSVCSFDPTQRPSPYTLYEDEQQDQQPVTRTSPFTAACTPVRAIKTEKVFTSEPTTCIEPDDPKPCIQSLDMTLPQKQDLSRKISTLATPCLKQILTIVKNGAPQNLRKSGEDWTFDLDRLNPTTLWDLDAYVNDQVKDLSMTKPTLEKSSAETQHMTPLTDSTNLTPMEEDGDREQELMKMKTRDPDDGDLGQVDYQDDEHGDEYVDYDYDYDYDFNDNDDDQGDLFDDFSEDQDNDNEDDDPDYAFSEEEKDKVSKHTPDVKPEPKRTEEDVLYQESDGDEYDFTPQTQTSKTGHTPVVQKKRKRVLSSPVKKEKGRSKDTKSSVTRRSGISSDTPAHRAKRRKKSVRTTKTTTAKKKKSTASSPLTNLPLVGSPPATGGGGGGGGGTVVKRAAGSPTSTGQSQGPYKIEICIYTLGKQCEGPRPYRCNGCNKTFADRSNLVQHLRTHTKERPYVCDWQDCKKRFAHSASLREHRNTHLGTRPHTCDECGRTFTQASNLRRHKKLHLGERPFVCTLGDCGKSFAQKANLDAHVKRSHRKGR